MGHIFLVNFYWILGIGNVIGCYGFCRIPLNSIGIYASALPSFLELVWSQGLLLSFVREVQRSFWLTNNFASLLRQYPFEDSA